MPRNATATQADPDTSVLEDANQSVEGPLDTLAAKAADTIDGAVELAHGLPETVDRAAATTGRALGEAQRTVQGGSDAALLAGASMAAGLAIGLLVGRTPRLVVAVALVPAAVLAMALVDRRSGLLIGKTKLLH